MCSDDPGLQRAATPRHRADGGGDIQGLTLEWQCYK
jgi:hypothetical protein